MHTSVLDRMCGGLCDAVLETRQSAQTLQALERSNRFVVPLDRRGEWYRYHHLFGQLLRNELERTDPEAVAVLNRRAMAWCMANDLPEAAVRYGHAAGETAIVAGLVDELALPLYTTTGAWRPWRSGLVVRPRRAGAVPRAGGLRGLAPSVDRAAGRGPTVAVAGRWSHLGDPLSDGSATIVPWVANLRACMMSDGVERALADAHLALKSSPRGAPGGARWSFEAPPMPCWAPATGRGPTSCGRRHGSGQRRL